MKIKTTALVMALALMLCSCTADVAENEQEKNSGIISEEVNCINTTDESVYLDGLPIQAAEAGGKTVISLSSLEKYGFIVSEENGVIKVTTDYMPEGFAGEEVQASEPGVKIADTVDSSAQVYINGIKTEAYFTGLEVYVPAAQLGELTDDYNKEFGYSDYNFNCEYDAESKTLRLNAFRFPELDSEKIIAEREALFCNKEFELYTEGDSSEGVYFGAKSEPVSGVLAGMISDGNGNIYEGKPKIFENSFGCWSNYMEFDLRSHYITMPLAKDIDNYNCVLCIPWNTSDVTQVYECTDYMKETLDSIAEYKKPVIIRFAAEMNVSNLGDSPAAYVKAFRFVADYIHENYPDMAVMWSPNDAGALNRPMSLYYPGDEYVDWIGVSSFLKRDFMGDPNTGRNAQLFFYVGDYAWGQISLRYLFDFMERNNIHKPVAISEGGVVTSMPYDSTNIDDWAIPRLRSMYWYVPMCYPEVKLITYFNLTREEEVYGFSVEDKPEYVDIMEDAFNNGPYLTEYPSEPKFVFVKADGHTSTGGTLPLYTYSYIPEEYTLSVSYSVDGSKIAEVTDIPYKYELDTSSMADGKHILTIDVNGEQTKDQYSYVLEKKGNAVEISREG